MGEQIYEYVSVDLPPGAARKNYDRELTEALNSVAGHGWRLVYVLDKAVPMQAIFERPKK